MRLIDVAPMLEYLDVNHYDNDWMVNQYNADWISSWLESQPTIEAEPVKHARWVDVLGQPHLVQCSGCASTSVSGNYNYCPNCGAYMRGDRK